MRIRLKASAWLMLYFIAVPIAMLAMFCAPARAQTVRIDSIGTDSVRIIVKAGGSTFDSAQVTYKYGAIARNFWLVVNHADTARFSRIAAKSAQTDSFTMTYRVITKPKVVSYQIAARVVVPPPIIVPPTQGGFVVPTLPAAYSVAVPTVSRTVRVSASDNLQTALNAAQPGDQLLLADGAQWTGNFTLPKHAAGWVLVRGETCVAEGARADVSNPSATVWTANSVAAITTAPGAAGWYLACFNVKLSPIGIHNNNILRLGSGGERMANERPSDIVLDRMIVSGSTTGGTARCVSINGARQAVIASRLLECHAKGSDAQAIAGWGGPGPYLLENNTLEASGEVIMFGGSDPQIAGAVPSDITIRRNHLFRPMAWATQWTIKNLFELKNAARVLFEGNVLENNWIDGQAGFAILLKAVSQQNTAPWTTMQDITVRNNIIRNSTSGINVAYRTGTVPTIGTTRVLLENNAFEEVGRDPRNASAGRLVQLLNEVTDVTFISNTFTTSGRPLNAIILDGVPTVRLTFRNNSFPASSYGVKGTGTAVGDATWARFAPGGVFIGNVLPGVTGTTGFTAVGSAGIDRLKLDAATSGAVR